MKLLQCTKFTHIHNCSSDTLVHYLSPSVSGRSSQQCQDADKDVYCVQVNPHGPNTRRQEKNDRVTVW